MYYDFSKNIEIYTHSLSVRSLEPVSFEPLKYYLLRNREFFADILTFPLICSDAFFHDILLKENKMKLDGHGIRFYIFDKRDKELLHILGDISLMHINGGAYQSCKMGYKADREHSRRGIISEALKAVINFAFRELKLHKIIVNIMPDNIPSVNFAEKNGFKKEGISYDYMRINGTWRDHLRYSLINPDDIFINP